MSRPSHRWTDAAVQVSLILFAGCLRSQTSEARTHSSTEVTAIAATAPQSEAIAAKGRGMMGRGHGSEMRAHMTTLHAMFASRDKIKRTVKDLPDGAEKSDNGIRRREIRCSDSRARACDGDASSSR